MNNRKGIKKKEMNLELIYYTNDLAAIIAPSDFFI